MNEAVPILSIVIPTMGRPILSQTLESLAKIERFGDVEVLIVGKIEDAGVAQQVAEMTAKYPQIRHFDVQYEIGDSSEKKNTGVREAKADIIAFIDDDVVVSPEWALKLTEPFADPEVGVVSGPSLVPTDVPLMTRLAGLSLSSGAAGYVAQRYRQGQSSVRKVGWSQIIGCNMAYRRSTFEDVGGFKPEFWPGEEMFAAHFAEEKGHTLMFHPEASLYHYPRSSIARFWKQIHGYGATRVRLIRAGVQFEPSTIIPAIWVLSLVVLGALAPCSHLALNLLLLNLILYALVDLYTTLLTFSETWRPGDLLLFFVIPIMHISYGIGEWVEFFRPNKDLSEHTHK